MLWSQQDAQTVEHNAGTTTHAGYRCVVLAQFLTAFNDNAFRNSIVLLTFSQFSSSSAFAVSSLSTVLFLLPYAILSLLAGKLSDRYSKKGVFVAWKGAEIPMVLIGLAGLWFVSGETTVWPLALVLAMLTLLGLQTAFLAPARYGILPEILSDENLSPGNGYLELGTYWGSLSGTISAAFVVQGILHPQTHGWALAIMPIAAVSGFFASLFIPQTPPANPSANYLEGLNPKTFLTNWRILRSHDRLVEAVFGLTLFWAMATLFLLNAANFGSSYLGYVEPTQTNRLIVAISLGIGIGSWLGGWISRGMIQIGQSAMAAAVWGLAALGLTMTGLFGQVAPGVEYFWPVAILLVIAGCAAGVFVVPLNAYVEKHSPLEVRASCIATSNIVTVIGMISACVFSVIINEMFGAKAVFFVSALVLFGGAVYVFRSFPDYFIQFVVSLLTWLPFRLKVVGQENIPREGAALLIANHTSFVDGNIIMASVPRFVRFMVYEGFQKIAFFGWLGKVMKTVFINQAAKPKELVASLQKASELIQQGELVSVFVEGAITRTGSLGPFYRGYELILRKHQNVPIIPMYIDGTWPTLFSFSQGVFFKKWPISFRPQITVAIGEPLPANTPPEKLREEIQLLGGRCFEAKRHDRLPLQRQFVRTARRHPRSRCMADLNTPMINYGTALLRSVVLYRLLKRKLGSEKYVGLLVPPSVGGALANLAINYMGRVPVNLNYTVGIGTLNSCAAQCGIKQIITSRKFMEKMKFVPDAELVYLEDLKGDLQLSDKLMGLAARVLPSFVTDRFLLGMGKHSMDDLATIIFSSGSTGDPKGVMLTQHNIVSDVESVVQAIDVRPYDQAMGVLPFFHSFGYTGTLWLPLLNAAAVTYHFNPLEPEVVSKLIRDNKCTIFVSTATFLRGHLRKSDPDDFKSMRLIICGAEKLPMQVADQFEKRFGVRPMEGYGCTELSPAVSTNRPDYTGDWHPQVGNKPGTIGHPMPAQAARIVDPDTREPLPLGEEGMLLIKGPNLMKGYLNKPDLTAAAIQNGWYATGDIAKLDVDGFITITDRVSRFSKIGGEMVPHGKVEDLLHEILETHDKVFAVVGVPDARKGERLVVIHTPLEAGVDQVWEKLRDSGIPPIWLPAKAAFFEVPELPILGTGKLDMKQVKVIAHEKMGF